MFPQRIMLRRNGINHFPFTRNFGLGGVFFRNHLSEILKRRREENQVNLNIISKKNGRLRILM